MRILLISSVVFLFIAGYATYAYLQPIAALSPSSTFSYSRAASAVPLTWPSYGEAAVGAVDFGVLATHGAEKPLPTASAIKILTALVVLQKQPLADGESGPTITLTQADVDAYNKYISMDGSVVRVAAGEQLTEYQALEALLLPSANNIAETLARWSYGSIDSFNSTANAYARTLGMNATTVTDPSGFLSTTTSTPSDLVTLGIHAMNDPVIAKIVREPTAIIPVQGAIRNVNILLGHEGIVGIKTGNNDGDLGCFLFASSKPVGTKTITIVGAIMDGPTLGTAMWDSIPLIRSAAAGFSDITVVHAGDTVATYSSPWQGTIHAVADSDISMVVWNGAAIKSSLTIRRVSTPQQTESKVGTLQAGRNPADTSQIILHEQASSPGVIWRLLHPFRARHTAS